MKSIDILKMRRPSTSGLLLSVNVSPPDADGTELGGPAMVTTNSVTASASGGTAPYSYSWSWVGASDGITIASPSSASTTFRKFMMTGTTAGAVARVTATDANSNTATDDVPVFLECI